MKNQQPKQNFTLKGRRQSDVVLEKGEFSFEMSVRQKIGTDFMELIIPVIVPFDIWSDFKEKYQTEWLHITGYITSKKELIDGKLRLVYGCKAFHVTNYLSPLYEINGGECFFSGNVTIIRKKAFNEDENVEQLHGRKIVFLTETHTLLEALLMRQWKNDADNISENQLVNLSATVVPSRKEMPYLTIKNIVPT